MRTVRFFLSLLAGGLMTAAVFLWIAAGEIYDYEDSFNLDQNGEQVDVVLCLAGGKGRISMAVDLWLKIKAMRDSKKLPAPVLFLSGVGPHANFDTLLDQGVSKDILKSIQKDQVVFENVSANTYENVQIFSSFVRQKQWKHPVLVTAGYHMRRARFILRKALDRDIQVMTETVDTEHFDRNRWRNDSYAVRVTIIEYLKWLYYRYSY